MLPKKECACLGMTVKKDRERFSLTLPHLREVDGLISMIQPPAFAASPCTKLADADVHQLPKLSLGHASHLLFLVCFE